MIPVEEVFKRVQDLSRKDKSGYMSSEEFTRDLNEAQQILMDFYWDQFSNSQYNVDSLNPFLKEIQISISNGYCAFPNDYRHRVEVGNVFIKNNCGEGCKPSAPSSEETELRYLHPSEERLTVTSPIRKPDILKRRIYHTFVDNKIKILPKETKGFIIFKYVSQPPEAIYATTVNQNTDKEEFDSQNSIDLIWNLQDKHNIIDILLFFKGIQTRETALINWVMARKNMENAK